MTSQITVKALGLNTSPNQLNLEEGSLSIAKNVIIRRDNVIEPRRGFKLWGESLGTSSDRAKQLFVYKKRILRHFSSTLQFQNGTNNDGTVNFDNFSGNYSEVQDGLRIKGIEANSNFYFTTSDGIKKISAKTSDDLSTAAGYVKNSGVPKALDIDTFLDIELGGSSGFLPADSAVAYRVVWGYKDLNENLLLGSPSEREEIYNPILSLIQSDLNNILANLDKIGKSPNNLISDANYLSTLGVTASSSADTVRSNTISLAQKIDEDIRFVYLPDIVSVSRLSNVVTITFSGGDATQFASVGDTINLTGFSASFNGNHVLTSVTTNTMVFNQTGSNETSTSIGTIYNNTSNAYIALFLVQSVASSNNVVTITFKNNGVGPLTNYFAVGDYIFLNSFGTLNGVSINNFRQIANVNNTARTIEFTVSGTGTGSTTTFGSIVCGNYRQITQPPTLSLTPTSAQLRAIQTYLNNILDKLKDEKIGIIQNSTKSLFITPLNITSSVNVILNITIPEEITTDYFYQVYRSETVTATGTDVLSDLVPSDELQQVFEGFVTQAEIDAGVVQFKDITPDTFRGANLYTNANSGVGILQSNDPPPLSTDIALFKGYTFYSNTKTRHQKSLDLLGVQKIKGGAIATISANNPSTITTVDDHDLQTGDFVFIQGTNSEVVNGIHKITKISNTSFTIPVNGTGAGNKGSWSNSLLNITNNLGNTNIYSFVLARAEQNTITVPSVANIINGEYFLVNSSDNQRKYAVYMDKTGNAADPNLNGYKSVRVYLVGLTTAAQAASAIYQSLYPYSFDFTTTLPTSTTVRITNVNAGFTDALTFNNPLTNFTVVRDVIGVGQQLQQLTQTVTTVADTLGSLAGKAMLLNAPFNRKAYYFWFSVSGVGTDPDIAGLEGYKVDINTNATAAQVATALALAINQNISSEFTANATSNNVKITAVGFGDADFAKDYSIAPPGFSYVVNKLGILTVEKSSEISPSIATDKTARSLIEAINKNKLETIYGYYLSGADDVSGRMFLESRTLSASETPFYINGGNVFGTNFNPDISAELTISAITPGVSKTTITANAHGFTNGQNVLITNSNSIPSIDGIWTVSNVTANTFDISKVIKTAGTAGFATLANNSEFSDNQDRSNRIYYSKFQQPEAVPFTNFIDVGAKDKSILRIISLRDSLFIFKEDGLYRLSGESAPFNVSLFDGSCVLLAPDSLGILENMVYGYARSGIVQISESGINTISRSIDNVILPTSSSAFTHFKKATFGIGYESDQSYIVWTVKDRTDEVATIAYRYHTITRTWTTYDKTNTCGIVSPVDDLIYLGAADTNFLEQERKNYNRTDYADRQIETEISSGLYDPINKTIKLNSVANISVGDVVTQEQHLTVFEYNTLLRKLDLDSGPADDNYFSTLEAVAGNNLRLKIIALAQKLDADANVVFNTYESDIANKSGTVSNISGLTEDSPTIITSPAHGLITGRVISITGSNSTPTLNGTHVVTVINANTFSIPVNVKNVGTSGNFSWTTLDNDFRDIATCYNEIIRKLNLDNGVNYSNYKTIDTETTQESIILAINKNTKTITLNNAVDYVIGPITIYNAIETEFQYTPITMQDPLGWKHLREATIMYENRAFTSAILSFATDLLPEFIEVTFDSDGNGIFGFNNFGNGFFGGGSNSAPFRTYIPRQCQRCRYILLNYKHRIAREIYAIFGMTLTGNISQSSRAYRG
jgi:hypothetical protein